MSETKAARESKPQESVQADQCSATKTENVQPADKPGLDIIRARLDRLHQRGRNSERQTSEKVETGGKHQKDGSVIATREIILDLVDVEAGTESRIIRDDVVQEYTELIKAGTVFPPIDLYEEGGKYFLADGFHRTTAVRSAGLKTIRARIFPGGRLGGLKAALGANETHGLRRSVEDKRYAVDKALREFVELSDRAIAEMCHVSPTFVAGRRDLQKTTVHVDSSSGDEQPKRLGRDGKARRQPRGPAAEKDKTVSAEALSTEIQEPAGSSQTASDVSISDRVFGVVQYAQKLLAKRCSRLRKAEWPVFWERIAILANKEAGLYRDEARRAAQARSSGG